MLENLDAQTKLAMEKDKYMDKWGAHQNRQLYRSLNLQIKNNFRDKGVANFGGELFNQVADAADDIYNNMDPPQPSLKPQQNRATTNVVQVQTKEEFADYYNNSYCGGGCFVGDNLISMADGSKKTVASLRKGDMVATPAGCSKVRCVIKTLFRNGEIKLCELENGLKVTPGHPVMYNNEWKYPRDIVSPQIYTYSCHYNLVLEKDHIAYVNDTPLILLGHNYT